MSGRADYEERRKQRIERYKELSKKAEERSTMYGNSNANRILQIAPGQPILVGHHSEKKHRRLIEKAHNDIRKSIEESSIVFTDQSTSYVDIAGLVEIHISEKSTKQTTKETLKWVHIFISNAKRNLLGNYHKIKRKNLQLYLDEFVYKLNRRYFGAKLFDRLVIASITGI